MFSDIPQEVQHRHPGGPVKVVDHYGGVIALEGDKALYLAADALHPTGHNLFRVHDPFPGLLGVADLPRRAADQQVRFMTSLLQAAGEQDLDEIAHVQARGRRIETHIELDGTIIQVRPQGVQIS